MTNGDDDLGRKTVLTFGTEVAAEHRSHRSTVDAAVELKTIGNTVDESGTKNSLNQSRTKPRWRNTVEKLEGKLRKLSRTRILSEQQQQPRPPTPAYSSKRSRQSEEQEAD